MSSKPVTKAVIAAAGFGTRFLPQTKAMPKEMLPIVDKPVIQYVVEDLVAAGIKDIIIVTGYSKRSIEDHFDYPNQDLIANLRAGGAKKAPLLKQIESIANLANFIYIRQKGALGTATPVLNAAHLIGDEPFIFTYADDLIEASPNRFQQMVDLYNELKGTIVPCIKVQRDEDFERYGMAGGDTFRDGVIKMNSFIEKPGRANAPSDLASIGGFLLTPDIFSYLERQQTKLPKNQEFFITTYGLQPMIDDGKAVYGCELQNSVYHDTGNKLEYLKTVVDFALKRDDLGDAFCEYLRSLTLEK